MEKVGDVAGLGCKISGLNHMEKSQPTSGFSFGGKETLHGKVEMHGKNLLRSCSNGQPSAHKGRRSRPIQYGGSKDGEQELTGKRKAASVVSRGDRCEGKRYRLVDEREVEWSDNPMSLLSWNCRRLGNPWAVQDLHQLVKEKKPNLVFLMETKLHNKNLDFLRIRLRFDHLFMVDI
jgi:hypothetical protein